MCAELLLWWRVKFEQAKLNAMDIASTPRGTGWKGRRSQSMSILSCTVDGECCRRRLVKLRGLLLLLTCFVLSAVICMAVGQFSHLPRFSRNNGEAYDKINYMQGADHGANRGPHLGQKPRSPNEDTEPTSRKLLNQVDLSFLHDSSGKEVQSFFLFGKQHASLAVPLDRKQK